MQRKERTCTMAGAALRPGSRRRRPLSPPPPPPPAAILPLLALELVAALLGLLTDARDLLVASGTCRALRAASWIEGIWSCAWAETTKGKVFVPSRALALAKAQRFRSALAFAVV